VSHERIDDNAGPIAALLAVQLLFGSVPVAGKMALVQIPALALAGLRVGIATVILVIFQSFRKRFWLVNRSDYWRLAVLALFGVVFNQMFSLLGISLTRASNASLLIVTIPIFTLVVSFLIGSEKITVAKIAGISLALLGATILIDPRNASFSSDTTLGDAFVILNSLVFGIYVATSKEVVTRNGAFRSMMWVFVFSSIICIPVAIYSFSAVDAYTISGRTWLVVAYLSVLATAAPYLLNAFAISKVSPTAVAVFIYLQPPIGFILAAIFLNEQIGLRFAVAAAAIFCGVYLVSKRPMRATDPVG
jgi:drug/metabolite transporter (DMT)-like permease